MTPTASFDIYLDKAIHQWNQEKLTNCVTSRHSIEVNARQNSNVMLLGQWYSELQTAKMIFLAVMRKALLTTCQCDKLVQGTRKREQHWHVRLIKSTEASPAEVDQGVHFLLLHVLHRPQLWNNSWPLTWTYITTDCCGMFSVEEVALVTEVGDAHLTPENLVLYAASLLLSYIKGARNSKT